MTGTACLGRRTVDQMKEGSSLPAAPSASRLARVPSYLRALSAMIRPSLLPFLPVWLDHVRSTRGWLRIPDGYLLFRLARNGPTEGSIVEIGSAWGRSTLCLAAGSRSANRERVVAIDPHTGDAWFLEDAGVPQIDSFGEFSANIHSAGLGDWVEPMVMTSETAARDVPPAPIRLLFIDGLHTLDGVERDIADWVPRVRDGGVIVFDDYDNVAEGVGVRTAVDRLLVSGLVEPKLRRAFNLVWTYRVAPPAKA